MVGAAGAGARIAHARMGRPQAGWTTLTHERGRESLGGGPRMKFIYFTKFLQSLDVKDLVAFCKSAGLDGVDLAVRPGYPIHPGNAPTALPEAAKAFADEGLM